MASYFFSRGGGDTSSATKFVSTIARQLADRSPKFKNFLQDAVLQDRGIVQRVLKDQWKELILTPLSQLGANSLPSPLIIVVDALDECDTETDIRQVLQILANTGDLDRRHFRVLVTSRPDMPICDNFLQLSHTKYQNFILHDISNDVVDDDIRRFLKHKLKAIRPEEHDVTQLVQMSGGLFIWAATACRFIGNGLSAKARLQVILGGSTFSNTPEEYVYGIYVTFLQKAIKSLLWNASILYFWAAITCGFVRDGLSFKQWLYVYLMSSRVGPEAHLDWIYLTVLNRSLDPDTTPPTPREIKDFSSIVRDVLGSIVLLFSPLSVNSLSRLLLIPEEDVRRMLRNLHSILDTPNNETIALRLHHPSFRDFLLNKRRCYDTYFWVDEKQTHEILVDRCIKVMSTSLEKDICKVRFPGMLAAEVEGTRIEQCLPPEVQYACVYWIQHLQESSTQLYDNDKVHQFLQVHLLHWLEALGWIGKTSEGIQAILSLEAHVPVGYLSIIYRSLTCP
jgi:hypothetical protein